ncbi:MAG: GNAT family N-acetyltransferase [Povalibacter sp.]|jgi:GNAT superfamily N-acetyltransferase
MIRNPRPVVHALVESLRADPFYIAIAAGALDDAHRDRVLEQYFDYSMSEGARSGRCVIGSPETPAAAVWLLPADAAATQVASAAKKDFLRELLPTQGFENYERIIAFMTPRAQAVTKRDAWYLSIVGVSPRAQGKGIGASLLQTTLAEADELGAPCFLETYTAHNLRFYERLEFVSVASHVEPVTACEYFIMQRSIKQTATAT